ncbi:hypothetical protein BaRGS_00013921, partial [Batillaria attramentaria]
EQCEILHGHLAEIHSATENNFLTSMVRSHGGNAAWIGLEDFVIENDFVWSSSQQSPEYTNWGAGEPNNVRGSEDCTVIGTHGLWYDTECEASQHCAPGWTYYSNSCYIHIPEAYTWFEAQVACQALHGHMVVINSAGENNFVANLAKSHGSIYVWIDLQDIAIEGEYVWSTTQQRAEYTNWRSGQPDHSGEDCVVLGGTSNTGTWADDECDQHKYPFICQAG